VRTVTFEELQERHPRLFSTAQWSNCPTGWLPLLAELCERIETEHPGVSFAQVKDKFAELRVYLNECSRSAERLVAEYARRSRTTCEVCGAPGKQSGRGWLVVRCEEHTP
jgi:hypothetical protein